MPLQKDPEDNASVSETTPLFAAIATSRSTRKDGSMEVMNVENAPKPQCHSMKEDILDTFHLGVPIFISMLSWVGVSGGYRRSKLVLFNLKSGLVSHKPASLFG